MKQVLLLLAGLALAGCATRAVISDLETDKVKVQHNNQPDDTLVMKTANDGCRIHNRYALAISSRCLDQYCINKETLFACKE